MTDRHDHAPDAFDAVLLVSKFMGSSQAAQSEAPAGGLSSM
jgi:hypothetical protein